MLFGDLWVCSKVGTPLGSLFIIKKINCKSQPASEHLYVYLCIDIYLNRKWMPGGLPEQKNKHMPASKNTYRVYVTFWKLAWIGWLNTNSEYEYETQVSYSFWILPQVWASGRLPLLKKSIEVIFSRKTLWTVKWPHTYN